MTVAADRLAALRGELARRGVHGFLVPRADEHQGEYVPPNAERLAWLTGFTGSAGLAAVLPERAAIFVDGRYTLQAKNEVDAALYEQRHVTEAPATDWIAKNLKPGQILGYDPRLHTLPEIDRYAAAATTAGGTLQGLDANPLDAVWRDRPPPPMAPVVPHELRFAGRSSAEKRRQIAAALAEDKVDAAALTAPDSIAWLLNIRGGDVPYTPLPLSFAILRADASVELFIDAAKLTPETRAFLGNDVAVAPPDRFGATLESLKDKRVQADPGSASAWVFDRLKAGGARVHRAADPCLLAKACKNEVELDGARAAHRRDGAALTRFLAWLAATAPQVALREIAVSDRLEELRSKGEHFRGLSFPTISGAGSNGAIVHYRASPASEKMLAPGSFYLVDSGAQYLDGTTDVTRTIAIGEPSPEMRDRFTRVLKGHIALAHLPLSQGHDRIAARRSGAPRAVAGRTRLRSRHRPRRRLLSFRARGAAADLQGGEHASIAAGHDRVGRAGLLPRRRLRHPHRESGRGGRGGTRSRRAPAVRVRDADPGADRPQRHRASLAERRGNQLARRLPRPRARGADAAGRSRHRPMARRRDGAAGLEEGPRCAAWFGILRH